MSRAAPAPHPPSVERLLSAVRMQLDGVQHDHAALVSAARDLLAVERSRLGGGGPAHDVERLAAELLARLAGLAAPAIPRVLNATGVIVHTNLGRAPWAAAAIEAATLAARGNLLLELDPSTGRRGPRVRVAEEH